MKKRIIGCVVFFSMIIALVIPVAGIEPTTGIQENLVEKLALCITDNNASDVSTVVATRFAQYVDSGFEAVRIMPEWETTSSSNWSLEDESRSKIQMAVNAGLTIKLIPATVMYNPDYLITNEDTRMENQYGQLSNANCISYWYDGLEDHVTESLTAQLTALDNIDCLDAVGGIVLDAGAAGETIYPAGWTQESSTNSMWCYADNATEDFRTTMENKYGSIEQANTAWGTAYGSFDVVAVPKPGDISGAMWGDTLSWYLEVKRDFIEREIQIYQNVLNSLGYEDICIIIYLPGTWVTEAEWNSCVASGTATDGIMLGADNKAVVDLAAEYNCCLQYTGVESRGGVDYIRQYMYDNGYEDIPVFGENAAHDGLTSQIDSIFNVIMDTNLRGVDFTDCSFLFNENGEANSAYELVEENLSAFITYLSTYDYSYVPNAYIQSDSTTMEGAALQLMLNINKDTSADISYFFLNIASLNYTIQDGDVLEYDVMLNEDMHGVGHIDASLSNGTSLRDCGVTDNTGINCHPMGDLSPYATGVSYHRSMQIGSVSCVGKTIQNLQLAAHPQVSAYGAYANGTYTVWYDNIRITNNGETKLVIFADGSDYINLSQSVALSSGICGSLSMVNIGENQNGITEYGDVLRLQLNINKATGADIAYFFLNIQALDYEIQEGDVLEYDVMLNEDMHGIGHIDASLSGGIPLRDCGVTDDTGMNCHPMGDLSTYAHRNMYHRSIQIGGSNCVGQTIQYLQLAAHPQASAYGSYENGTYTVWYDNICITNNGETKLVVFEGTSDYATFNTSVALSSEITGALSVVQF